MTTLIQVLSNPELDCDKQMGIYAQKINGKFHEDSPAHVEQCQGEDKLADGFEFFSGNEVVCFDRADFCQGDTGLFKAWARGFIARYSMYAI